MSSSPNDIVEIIVGESYDGFSLYIVCDGDEEGEHESFWFSQEEPPSENMVRFLKRLGFKTSVQEDY